VAYMFSEKNDLIEKARKMTKRQSSKHLINFLDLAFLVLSFHLNNIKKSLKFTKILKFIEDS